jgi:phosphoglycerate-specific signal transduction histidine kinase
MNQVETEQMLQRLSVAQEKLPLVLEMAKLEEDALRESRLRLQENSDEE